MIGVQVREDDGVEVLESGSGLTETQEYASPGIH